MENIRRDVLMILDKVHDNRQKLNKHFQNSMVNYFLRNLNFLRLKHVLGANTPRELNFLIHSKYINSEGALYMKLIFGYYNEICQYNLLEDYR